MQDEYKKSYLVLFNAVTDALTALSGQNYGIAESLLKLGQIQAEEAFIQAGEDKKE